LWEKGLGDEGKRFVNQSAYNIYLYNLESDTGSTLTTQTTRNVDPDISGTNVVWSGKDAQGDMEIFFHDLLTGQTYQLTNNRVNDLAPDIKGNRVVWQSSVSSTDDPSNSDSEVFYLDLKQRDPVTGQPINTAIQITNNARYDGDALVDGKSVVWRSGSYATGFNLLYWNADFRNRIEPIGSDIGLSKFGIDANHIVWSGGSGSQAEIYLATLEGNLAPNAAIAPPTNFSTLSRNLFDYQGDLG
jgi:Tol biopolymer transport system component